MSDEPTPTVRFPLIPVIAVVIVGLGLGGVLALRLPANGRPDPYQNVRVPDSVDLSVPPFELIDANGEPIDQSILDGGYTVMDFFFTHCPLVCPRMTAEMRRVQAATEGTRVRLLSVSVDGGRDTPDVIGRYANAVGADPQRWIFATGERADVWSICDALQLSIEEDAANSIPLPEGGTMANVDHPSRLILVGPDRRVIAMASFARDHDVNSLIEFAREQAR
ncbi:MAG: hypothetical protein CMJ31_08475 [Phycisphaerae bacterium]|nr:hypothetical protein [Phycisphaerae bacterium]